MIERTAFESVGSQAIVHLPLASRFRAVRFGKAAVFLDRDATLIDVKGHLTRAEEIRLLPGAVDAVRQLAKTHYVVVVTNQSAIGRGLLSEQGLLEIHTELVRRVSEAGAGLDALVSCPHWPGGVAPYDLECDCRKPAPGMLLGAAETFELDLSASFLIGDAERDIVAASRAGVRSLRIPANQSGALQEAAKCLG